MVGAALFEAESLRRVVEHVRRHTDPLRRLDLATLGTLVFEDGASGVAAVLKVEESPVDGAKASAARVVAVVSWAREVL